MADTLVSRVLREPVVSATEPRKTPITHTHTHVVGRLVRERSVRPSRSVREIGQSMCIMTDSIGDGAAFYLCYY